MKKLLLCLSFITLLSSTLAAHEPRKGPNGGMVVDAGSYHAELVAKNGEVSLFVSDGAYKPLSANGFKAIAILLLDGKNASDRTDPGRRHPFEGDGTGWPADQPERGRPTEPAGWQDRPGALQLTIALFTGGVRPVETSPPPRNRDDRDFRMRERCGGAEAPS